MEKRTVRIIAIFLGFVFQGLFMVSLATFQHPMILLVCVCAGYSAFHYAIHGN